MQIKTEKRVFAEIEGCPRCGGSHKERFVDEEKVETKLLFMPLSNPQTEAGEGDMWAFCPETNEPILISSANM